MAAAGRMSQQFAQHASEFLFHVLALLKNRLGMLTETERLAERLGQKAVESKAADAGWEKIE